MIAPGTYRLATSVRIPLTGPVTRCSKGLQNGPCGGTTADGKCEVNPEMDCAWLLIYNKLKESGVGLEGLREYLPPKDERVHPGQRTLSRGGGEE